MDYWAFGGGLGRFFIDAGSFGVDEGGFVTFWRGFNVEVGNTKMWKLRASGKRTIGTGRTWKKGTSCIRIKATPQTCASGELGQATANWGINFLKWLIFFLKVRQDFLIWFLTRCYSLQIFELYFVHDLLFH